MYEIFVVYCDVGCGGSNVRAKAGETWRMCAIYTNSVLGNSLFRLSEASGDSDIQHVHVLNAFPDLFYHKRLISRVPSQSDFGSGEVAGGNRLTRVLVRLYTLPHKPQLILHISPCPILPNA